jgi:hypothetical protein
VLTAATITVEQVKALLDDDTVEAYLAASRALGIGGTSEPLSAHEMAEGRARCAEILNARSAR